MKNDLLQVGWRSRLTGEICDCPVYERSPHANSDPIYVNDGTQSPENHTYPDKE